MVTKHFFSPQKHFFLAQVSRKSSCCKKKKFSGKQIKITKSIKYAALKNIPVGEKKLSRLASSSDPGATGNFSAVALVVQ